LENAVYGIVCAFLSTVGSSCSEDAVSELVAAHKAAKFYAEIDAYWKWHNEFAAGAGVNNGTALRMQFEKRYGYPPMTWHISNAMLSGAPIGPAMSAYPNFGIPGDTPFPRWPPFRYGD
jgi:hypothetical protein